jgi:hypothetical protein
MQTRFLLPILFIFITLFPRVVTGQTTTIGAFANVLKYSHNIGLNSPTWNWTNPACPMTYNLSEVDAKGGAFSLYFSNQIAGPAGNMGTGYKGYPSGTIGGFKKGGTYYPGVVSVCGMPKKIIDINHDLRIKWKVSQSNVGNEGGVTDKWFASLNVIFDDVLDGTTEPNEAARDYDLVIELNRFEQEDLSDKSKIGNTVYWKFARNPDLSLKTFDLNYGGEIYKWAVRYKFFNYPAGDPNVDKNDKVHVKFICVDNTHVAPYIDHSLKLFINTSKNYLIHANLDATETALANSKVALDNTWVKSLSAGYEIYQGDFTIRNDYFYTVIDNIPPPVPVNLTAIPNTTTINLNWDDVAETSLEGYDVFRSVNGGSFQIIGRAYTSDYVDNGIVSTNSYAYYVKAIDRSFNTSSASNTVNLISPLPIELLNFTLKKLNNHIQLTWSTATETNNKEFEIERSADATQWKTIGIVKGSGNSTTIKNYTFIDSTTLASTNYYRLKQIDFSGSYQYSKILSMTLSVEDTKKNIIQVFPNPFTNSINIRNLEGNEPISIFDMQGKLLKNFKITNEGEINLELDFLPSYGIYVLKIGNNLFKINKIR